MTDETIAEEMKKGKKSKPFIKVFSFCTSQMTQKQAKPFGSMLYKENKTRKHYLCSLVRATLFLVKCLCYIFIFSVIHQQQILQLSICYLRVSMVHLMTSRLHWSENFRFAKDPDGYSLFLIRWKKRKVLVDFPSDMSPPTPHLLFPSTQTSQWKASST